MTTDGKDIQFWDVTLPLGSQTPIYPNDPEFKRRLVQSLAYGDKCDVSILTFCAHTGTHVDAPSHLFPNAQTVDGLNLNILIGPVSVVEYDHRCPITINFLEKIGIVGEKRVLFKARNSHILESSKFLDDCLGISVEAAFWLVNNGTKLVGIDRLSVDAMNNPDMPVHKALLSSNVIVVEGLDLQGITKGNYTVVCLPMKIQDSDGAPARVILLSTDSNPYIFTDPTIGNHPHREHIQ